MASTNRDELLNDIETAMRLMLDGRQSCLWTAIPGRVTEVSYSAMTVSVQPLIKGTILNENGTETSVDLPLLIHVPIVWPGAAGFIMTFPVPVDSEVLVIFSSRCIDAWWQSGGIQKPMEARMHDLSDGFAIPGPRSQPNVVSGISSTEFQIRNGAGTSYFAIGADGKLKIVAPAEVDITAPLCKITGNLTVSGTIVATGGITGATLATAGAGSATIGGAVNVTGDVIAGGVSLKTHVHSGVTTGLSNTGAPV